LGGTGDNVTKRQEYLDTIEGCSPQAVAAVNTLFIDDLMLLSVYVVKLTTLK
jgi:hypothetical protein